MMAIKMYETKSQTFNEIFNNLFFYMRKTGTQKINSKFSTI